MNFQAAKDFISDINRTTFACPYCGHEHDGSESETAMHIVSYWGDDIHDFTCDHCGKDFFVREEIHRSFHAATTRDATWES